MKLEKIILSFLFVFFILLPFGFSQQCTNWYSYYENGGSVTYTCNIKNGYCEIDYVKGYIEACDVFNTHVKSAKMIIPPLTYECIEGGASVGSCGFLNLGDWVPFEYTVDFSQKINYGESVTYSTDWRFYENLPLDSFTCPETEVSPNVRNVKTIIGVRECCPNGYNLKPDGKGGYYCEPLGCQGYTSKTSCESSPNCCWVNGACYDKSSSECQSCSAITDQQECESNSACCWNNGQCYDVSSGNCTCTDTDNGNNPYQPGTCTDAFQSVSDYCE
jgi:hypothetical protein